jgi:hypothetical protein
MQILLAYLLSCVIEYLIAISRFGGQTDLERCVQEKD